MTTRHSTRAYAAPAAHRDPLTIGGTSRAQLDELGPLCLLACRIFMVLAPLGLFGALLGNPIVPRLAFLLPALGAAAVAPRAALLRIQVSISTFLLVCWMCLSYLWSIEPSRTLFFLREELGPVLGVILVAGILPVEETVKWFVRGMKLVLVVSAFALITDPESRVTVVVDQPEDAWEAWFFTKNQFGRFSVMALLTLLLLDTTVVTRWAGIITSMVFIIWSSSAASLAAMVVVWMLVWWVRRYHKVGQDWSATFVFVSILVGIGAIIGVYASAAWVVNALGRDLTFSGRTEIWSASLDFVDAEPWLGYGYAALFDGTSFETGELTREIGFSASSAHNGALDLALGVGLPGLMLFLVLYMSTFAAALRHLRTHAVATWAFIFLMLQQLVGIVEPVFTADWLGPLVLSRVLLSKVTQDERRRRDARDQLAGDITHRLDIDLDGPPGPVGATT